MESSSERSSAPESQLISRRTLVRAGATAAWAVPAIQIVGAAPAFAVCSNGKSDLRVDGFTANYVDAATLHVSGSVNATCTPQTLQVTIKLPATVVASAASVTSGFNWTRPQTVSGNSIVFTSTGTGADQPFDFKLSVSSTPSGKVEALPYATNQGAVTAGSYDVTGFVAKKPTLTVPILTGNYLAADASKMTVTARVANDLSAPTVSLTLAVKVPKSKYDRTPTSSAPTGWSGPGYSNDSNYWILTYTAGTQATSTAPQDLQTVLSFDDSTSVRKYAGEVFVLSAEAAATGAVTGSSSVSTNAAATNSTLSITKVGATTKPVFVSGSVNKTYQADIVVNNLGPKPISGLNVTVKLSRSAISLENVTAGWTGSNPSGDLTNWTFARTGTGAVAPSTSVTFTPLFRFGENNLPTGTFGATASGATSISGI